LIKPFHVTKKSEEYKQQKDSSPKESFHQVLFIN